MPFSSVADAATESLPTGSPFSSSSHLSAGVSPDHLVKRLSPSMSPVLSDHQLPALGYLSQRTSISSSSSSPSPAAACPSITARLTSPPIRALRRRSKSVSSFTSAMGQHSASLPVLMKPYPASTSLPPATASALPPLSENCSPLNLPTEGLPSLHPCLSPSVASCSGLAAPGAGGGAGVFGMRPRSKSFSVYEDEQAAAQQHGRLNARLPAVRVARIADRPTLHVIHDKQSRQQLTATQSNDQAQQDSSESAAAADDEDEFSEFPTCPVNPLLSPIVETDKEFFSLLSP